MMATAERPHLPLTADDHPDLLPTDVTAEPPATLDLPEVWGLGSFPASDPPANW